MAADNFTNTDLKLEVVVAETDLQNIYLFSSNRLCKIVVKHFAINYLASTVSASWQSIS